MPPRSTLERDFPGAVTAERFMARIERSVRALGFDRENTFAAVSICRDELTQSLLQVVSRRWDQPFSLGGLGGVPSLGRTGWGAALDHVPSDRERGNLLVFGFPHIGIAPDGSVGVSLRRHQEHLTTTCGAMSALFRSLHEPVEPAPPELGDHEFDRLGRIVDEQRDDPPASLLELTRTAAAAVEEEMWSELNALRASENMDVAVLCGIQVHMPDDVDHIWPTGASFQGADGRRVPLEILTLS